MSKDHGDPVSDSEVAAASGKSKSSSSSVQKLRIKIKLPDKRSYEGEKMEDDNKLMRDYTRDNDAVVEDHEHVCKLCGKGFRSKKALGGHMRVHSQREMVRTDDDELNKTGVDLPAYVSFEMDYRKQPVCPICRRNFPSSKALCGHMRCHPERNWRGIHAPVYSSSSTVSDVQEARNSWDKSDHDDVIDDDGDVNHDVMMMESEKIVVQVDLEKDLSNFGWGAKSMRGREATLKSIAAAVVVQGLIMLSRGGVDSNSGTLDQVESRGIRRFDHDSRSREEERGVKRKNSEVLTDEGLTNSNSNKNIKLASNDQEEGVAGRIKSAPSLQLTMADEADVMESLKDGLMQKHTNVNKEITNKRMNKVRKYLMINDLKSESAKYLPHQVNMEVSDEERYKCTTCNKSFLSPQALGGHKSSHNKNVISNNIEHAGASHNSLAGLMVGGTPPMHRLHQCNVCFKIYPTGQALGGHKRIHCSSLISKVAPLPQPPQPSIITLEPVLSAAEPLRPLHSIIIREAVEQEAASTPLAHVSRASGNVHGSCNLDLNELPPLEDDEDHNAPIQPVEQSSLKINFSFNV